MFRCVILAVFVGLAACVAADDRESNANTQADSSTQRLQDRFRVYESALDHSGTVAGLYEALDRRDLSVFSVIDHAAAAATVDMSLPPTTLVIFGSPRGGTPLIQADPLLGAELPLRALVYERDGQTMLAMTGMDFLARTYNLESKAVAVKKISDLINSIANEATSL